jgi:hypothetical protein
LGTPRPAGLLSSLGADIPVSAVTSIAVLVVDGAAAAW